jgi:hypothetical protein
MSIGTITFGTGLELETYNVEECQGRWIEKGDEAETVRIRIDRPYKGRTVLTMPVDTVIWTVSEAKQ